MPKQKITTELVRRLPRAHVDIYDAKYPGLVLRCRPSGVATYRVTTGRGQWTTIGRADTLTPDEARTEARTVLRGERPRKGSDPTFTQYLDDTYGPWVTVHRKSGAATLARLRAIFGPTIGAMRLSAIQPFTIEGWRTQRKKAGVTPVTINRDMAALRAALVAAVTWKLIATLPIADVKPLTVDKHRHAHTHRVLAPDELTRFLAALAARDEARRADRARANEWRRARGYAEWPALGTYCDHVAPVVLTALGTGMRRGEILSLQWAHVRLDPPAAARIHVLSTSTKTGQSRDIPLHADVRAVLATWRAQTDDTSPAALVFPGDDGGRMQSIKTAWRALVKAAGVPWYRYHDTRHQFATALVLAGVDLKTIATLLGHATTQMADLQYTHVNEAHKAAAVAKLLVTA